MDDTFYIVISEKDKTTQFANLRNAELEARALTIKDPDHKHYVMQAVRVAKAAPPVEVGYLNGEGNGTEFFNKT